MQGCFKMLKSQMFQGNSHLSAGQPQNPFLQGRMEGQQCRHWQAQQVLIGVQS
jgi:hypothetical protein